MVDPKIRHVRRRTRAPAGRPRRALPGARRVAQQSGASERWRDAETPLTRHLLFPCHREPASSYVQGGISPLHNVNSLHSADIVHSWPPPPAFPASAYVSLTSATGSHMQPPFHFQDHAHGKYIPSPLIKHLGRCYLDKTRSAVVGCL